MNGVFTFLTLLLFHFKLKFLPYKLSTNIQKELYDETLLDVLTKYLPKIIVIYFTWYRLNTVFVYLAITIVVCMGNYYNH